MGGGRVGVVHWGSYAPKDQVLALTDVRQRRRIAKALRIPAVTLGGNDFPAALERVAEVLASAREGRTTLVVALTDGIEELGTRIHPALAGLSAGSVHVLLVDRSAGCTGALEAQWRSLPLSFCRLDTAETATMAWQIAEALAAAVGLHMPGPAGPAQP